jgi:hypothetical protein
MDWILYCYVFLAWMDLKFHPFMSKNNLVTMHPCILALLMFCWTSAYLYDPHRSLGHGCKWNQIHVDKQAFSHGPKRGCPILVQWYIYSKEGGGGGVGKTFLWKTFEVYVTSCQYLFQPRSKFFKHTWLCEFVPLCFFT